MDKEDVVYMYTVEHYSAIKKNEITAATWMNLEIILLSEISQKKKTTDTIYHLHVESKIRHKWTYLQNSNTVT